MHPINSHFQNTSNSISSYFENKEIEDENLRDLLDVFEDFPDDIAAFDDGLENCNQKITSSASRHFPISTERASDLNNDYKDTNSNRPRTVFTFPQTDMQHDPDRVEAKGTVAELSTQFRNKIFDMLDEAGGLKNKIAEEAAIQATGYKKGTLESYFRKRKQLKPMKRQIYGYDTKDPLALTKEFNNRIQYMKTACLSHSELGKRSQISNPPEHRKVARTLPEISEETLNEF